MIVTSQNCTCHWNPIDCSALKMTLLRCVQSCYPCCLYLWLCECLFSEQISTLCFTSETHVDQYFTCFFCTTFVYFSLIAFSVLASLTLTIPLCPPHCSRSIRTLSHWPPNGPSPPSTPSATPSIRTERPRSSLRPCRAPSRPCPGSSARSTINETPPPFYPFPWEQTPSSSSRHVHHHNTPSSSACSSPPLLDPVSKRKELGHSTTASPPPSSGTLCLGMGAGPLRTSWDWLLSS